MISGTTSKRTRKPSNEAKNSSYRRGAPRARRLRAIMPLFARKCTVMTDDNASAPNGRNLPRPPVPQRLQEMLQDYPEHIGRLQEVLNTVVDKPSHLTPPFDVAVWVLESRLEAFYREAETEFEAAQATGNIALIAQAHEKQRLMAKACGKYAWFTDEALWNYFQRHQDIILRPA